jgi:hypothetical protein
MMSPTSAAVRLGAIDRTSAATPATCGEAIDVPWADRYVSSQ